MLKRKKSTLGKVTRMRKALGHEEPDRIPISDFFWGSFIKRWQQDLHLPPEASPYDYYDLDWMVTTPNMDPHIKDFETIKENEKEVIVKTGFETTIRKRFDFPMPEQISWDTDSIEKLEALEFDDPWDRRRYFEAGDNQIAGVGDGFVRNSPPWIETVESLWPDFPVYGSIIEPNECLTRLIGQYNAMLWMGMDPGRMGKIIDRIGAFYLECTKAQIKAANGLLDGFVIWGDVAYKSGMFFDPEYWRTWYKPWIKAMTEYCHDHDLPVIYHGCGNVKAIFRDFIDMGMDAYNPLEAKAGMDVIELRNEYGHAMAFCGNSNIQIWESGDRQAIKGEVLRKLNAAKGGGMIFQSDHSVTSEVSGQSYDYIVGLVREHGRYPIDLKEYDINI